MVRYASMVLSLGLILGLAGLAKAEDKPKTLEGTITCAKCDLKLVKDKCATVIKVKEGDKEVVYWLVDDKDAKENHKVICNEAKEGKVTGTIKKDGDKMTIKVTKVEFK